MRKILVIFLATISTMKAEELKLVSDGKSDYQIVIPSCYENEKIEPFIKKSAKLLQDCVEESTDVEIPIVNESERDKSKSAIFLGDTVFARKNGVNTSQLRGWTYVEKVIGKNIILAGNDHSDAPNEKSTHHTKYVLGTLKAVTSFLKEEVGVKFLLPGPNGIEVPGHRSISVKSDLDACKEPYLKLSAGRTGEAVYCIANNYYLANSFWTNGGHSYYAAVPAEKYGATYPEYFALLGGSRNPAGNHLCISNPEVFELMVKDMIKQLDKGYDYYEIGQTDGYKACECVQCKTLFGTSDPGEKLWMLHRKLAERLLKERPGKKVAIISYGPTIDPPKTFKKFPENVMIEISNYTPEGFEQWADYDVSGGFMTYLYNWGSYQQAGLTPKTTPRSVGTQAERFRKINVRAMYRCGWGELFGLEGPVYYVYGRMFDENPPNYRRITDEFYKYAYGKAYIPMKTFFDTMYNRLELYANYLAMKRPAQTLRPNNPKPVLAYNFSPDIIEMMEKNLQRAEKMAVKPKVKKRIELVRKEFEYVKNIAQIIFCYNAYKTSLDQASFDKLASLVEKRNKMIDSFYNDKGKMRRIPGWEDIKFLGGFKKSFTKANGRMSAPLGSPFSWDTKHLKKLGVLPGTLKKKLKIYKATENVSSDGNFESGAWKDVPYESMGGIQLEQTKQKSRFKMLYDDKNLYIGFSCTLPDGDLKISPVGLDGPAWQQESLELFIAPGSRDEYYHLIFNPAENSRYDAVNSMLIDPLEPLYGKDDSAWNGDWKYLNFIDKKKSTWNAIVIIPFKSLNTTMPKPGSIWYGNIGREHATPTQGGHKNTFELYLWSPNLETRSFLDREAFGEIIFSKTK